MIRKRFRDLGFVIGNYQVGKLNSITDVPGVLVGHTTLNYEHPDSIHTGVTVILPNGVWKKYSPVGFYLLNGNGDSTGLEMISEYGQISAPIALTNTHQVGLVRDSLIRYYRERVSDESFEFPLVTETDDSWISDNDKYPITAEHVFEAVTSASSESVDEGNIGAGTGLICFDLKGGVGTSSRLIKACRDEYTIGVLTVTNFGNRDDLVIKGVPIGRQLNYNEIPNPWIDKKHSHGSVVVVIATDAPLSPDQCHRIAKRAALGLGRVGCKGHDYSGDMIISFSTGNQSLSSSRVRHARFLIPHQEMDELYEAVIDATEEAVINSLTTSRTIVGRNGRKVEAIPLDFLVEALNTHMPG